MISFLVYFASVSLCLCALNHRKPYFPCIGDYGSCDYSAVSASLRILAHTSLPATESVSNKNTLLCFLASAIERIKVGNGTADWPCVIDLMIICTGKHKNLVRNRQWDFIETFMCIKKIRAGHFTSVCYDSLFQLEDSSNPSQSLAIDTDPAANALAIKESIEAFLGTRYSDSGNSSNNQIALPTQLNIKLSHGDIFLPVDLPKEFTFKNQTYCLLAVATDSNTAFDRHPVVLIGSDSSAILGFNTRCAKFNLDSYINKGETQYRYVPIMLVFNLKSTIQTPLFPGDLHAWKNTGYPTFNPLVSISPDYLNELKEDTDKERVAPQPNFHNVKLDPSAFPKFPASNNGEYLEPFLTIVARLLPQMSLPTTSFQLVMKRIHQGKTIAPSDMDYLDALMIGCDNFDLYSAGAILGRIISRLDHVCINSLGVSFACTKTVTCDECEDREQMATDQTVMKNVFNFLLPSDCEAVYLSRCSFSKKSCRRDLCPACKVIRENVSTLVQYDFSGTKILVLSVNRASDSDCVRSDGFVRIIVPTEKLTVSGVLFEKLFAFIERRSDDHFALWILEEESNRWICSCLNKAEYADPANELNGDPEFGGPVLLFYRKASI